MENKKLNVSYECHQCGWKTEVIEQNHGDVAMKQFPHQQNYGTGPACGGFCHPVALKEVE